MTEILMVVHMPLFVEANTLSNLRNVVTVETVPNPGDLFELPDGTRVPVGHIDERGDGRTVAHLRQPDVLRALLPQGAPAGDQADVYALVASLAEDLRASGYSGVSAWD